MRVLALGAALSIGLIGQEFSGRWTFRAVSDLQQCRNGGPSSLRVDNGPRQVFLRLEEEWRDAQRQSRAQERQQCGDSNRGAYEGSISPI
jgi:hypothetical protein